MSLRLVAIHKSFDGHEVLRGVSVDIERGEFFTFLGPSGSGKTTLLRIIAGLEEPDSGAVIIDGVDVTRVPPHMRGVSMVFQNYALWPHMTVFDNIAYGLRVRGVPEAEVRRRVAEVLELVRLRGLENRYPAQLSGGQQQRVALARALVVQPRILLLDEPLSNLDARLRIDMREELRRLLKDLGVTTVYVTHDQEEAFYLSDRIGILLNGKLVQVGRPYEVVKRPASLEVALFLGKCNVLKGVVESVSGDKVVIEVSGVTLRGVAVGGPPVVQGARVVAVFRPHSVEVRRGVSSAAEPNTFIGRVVATHYLGSVVEAEVETPLGRWRIHLPPRSGDAALEERIVIRIPEDELLVYGMR